MNKEVEEIIKQGQEFLDDIFDEELNYASKSTTIHSSQEMDIQEIEQVKPCVDKKYLTTNQKKYSSFNSQ